jgi:TPR repeat protein
MTKLLLFSLLVGFRVYGQETLPVDVKLIEIDSRKEGSLVKKWEKQGDAEIKTKEIFVQNLPDSIATGDTWTGKIQRKGAFTKSDGTKIPCYQVEDVSLKENRSNIQDQLPGKILLIVHEPFSDSLIQRAENGDAQAQMDLGYAYYYGKGVPKSCEQAVLWYEKSAAQNNANAINNLGACYANGEGVRQDIIKAASQYQKAAEAGFALGQDNYALMLCRGTGVSKDVSEAFRWHLKSALQGWYPAFSRVASHLEVGLGITQNQEAAKQWKELSINMQNEWESSGTAIDWRNNSHPGTQIPNANVSTNQGKAPIIRRKRVPIPLKPQEPLERIAEFEGHTFKFIPIKKSWNKAKNDAEKLGGYLVCINSEREQKFIADLITIDNKVMPTWIGLTDEQSEGDFRWVNGEVVQYRNWLPNQPDNYDHYGSKQNYVWLGYKNSSQWDDVYEHANLFSIVEFDKIEKKESSTNPQQNP